MPKRLVPGTLVAYYPGGGHRPEDHWLGTVVEHRRTADGALIGLTDIECTDPCGFLNNRVGLITTVETRKLRPVDDAGRSA
ncbi:hypothetical protein ABZX75_01095 [Streptomyces sp. NPDC003038]|uniref:hypothetical protein n=1 Tax=unclassified Streptomyces TaxID=2593676 RepID=UPI0033BDE4C9